MPPKKRGRPASKAVDPTVDDALSASEDLIAPPPKKRGRPPKPKQVADAEAASEDDSAPPPAKKPRARPKKIPAAVVELSDEEPEAPKPTKAKQPTKGKKAAAKAVVSGDDEAVIVPAKKAIGNQIAKDEDDDEQDIDVKPGTPKARAEDLFQKPIKKQQDDAQIARTKGLAVPVDEHAYQYTVSHRVYIDGNGVIYDAALNQSNVDGNNNKFYRIQILESLSGGDFVCWTRWGRVGDRGQSKPLLSNSFDHALADFSKKFKDKTGLTWDDRNHPGKPKKYVFIERSYEPDTNSETEDALPGAGDRRGSKQSISSSEDVKSKLDLPVQHLMELIFSQKYFKEVMADMAYDSDKMPLGKLSKRTLEQGYLYLKDIATLILNYEDIDPATHASKNDEIKELTNMYLSSIPHNMGRQRPQSITSEQQLKREIDLLESLSDMKIAEDIMKEAKSGASKSDTHPLDRQYAGLHMSEMTALDPKSTEFFELADYLNVTRGHTHNLKYEIEDIFRVRREGEFERFENSQYGKMSADRRLLWHGSRSTNFGGILSQGLRIAPPEAPVSGYMFGKGVYLADMSSKSANYCNHMSSGGIGLLLLCEAELGQPLLELTNADYNAGERAKEQGSHSTWGKGTTAPPKWKDAGCVHPDLAGTIMPDVSAQPCDSKIPGAYLMYNEFIAYDVNQIRLRYLFRVKMGH